MNHTVVSPLNVLVSRIQVSSTLRATHGRRNTRLGGRFFLWLSKGAFGAQTGTTSINIRELHQGAFIQARLHIFEQACEVIFSGFAKHKSLHFYSMLIRLGTQPADMLHARVAEFIWIT